ncbi:hypothetical protein [Streptacidiphilus cavernicola]|uniref:XRE family transcriptional regulator n=1 Tax=Streptacidiphilus cavernicola TaxID=3342716 RepID=A0ABV6VYB7_9ACTN
MRSAIAERIPLVRRPKPPGLPLAERMAALSTMAIAPAVADHHDLVARYSGVLNYAALIASDLAMPDLATELCWRQHQVFASAGHLTQGIAVMSLMPLVNIARLLIREGDGEGAYDVLQRLYRAAQQRGTAQVRGHDIDLSALIRDEADHRKICEELWVTVLIDGARALARMGRWTQAADAMAAHRGIGNRLLDGRQLKVMSLMEFGAVQEAADMIDASTPIEPWEDTVAALLRLACAPANASTPQSQCDLVVREALALIAPEDRLTVAFQVRLALTALDLTADQPTSHGDRLRSAVLDAALCDGYAARDVLHHRPMLAYMTSEQTGALRGVLTASGLDAGHLSPAHMHTLTLAVDNAEDTLHQLLAHPPQQNEPEEGALRPSPARSAN